MALKFIVLALLFVSVYANPIDDDKAFLEEIFSKIPPGERLEFLTYQLHLGYMMNHPADKYPLPKYDLKRFYDIFSGRDFKNKRHSMMEFICLDPHNCFDPSDPGIYPYNGLNTHNRFP